MAPWYQRRTGVPVRTVVRDWGSPLYSLARGNPKGFASGTWSAAKKYAPIIYNTARGGSKRSSGSTVSRPSKKRMVVYPGGRTTVLPGSRGRVSFGGSSAPRRMSVSSRRTRRPYNTFGRFMGAFKKGSPRAPYSKFVKLGALMRTEKGGIAEWDKCVYIGHSTCASEKIMTIAFQALVRMLAKKIGHDFESFKEPFGRVLNRPATAIGEIKLYYTLNSGDGLLENVHIITQDQTYESIAADLLTDVKGHFSGAIPTEYHLKYLEWYPYIQGAGLTSLVPLVKIKMENVKIHVQASSELTLQNRTLANSGANPEQHDSMLDVENNPIEGYSYKAKYSGLRMRFRNSAGNNHPVMFADQDSGVITLDPDNPNLSTEEKDLLQRPPGTQAFFGVQKSAKQRLSPGGLRRSKIASTKECYFNRLIQTFKQYLHDGGHKQMEYFGDSRVFAWEKMMHTTDATEPNMSIGYEINNFYRGYCYEQSSKILVDKDVL